MSRIFCLIVVCLLNQAYAQSFSWAKQFGSDSWDEAISMKTDANGNVYSIGHFDDTLDMDPGPGTFKLIPKGSKDVFISKLDSTGNIIWAKQFGGNAFLTCRAMTIDPTGDIIITGNFIGTADFDPGTGSFNMSSVYDIHVFICKLNASGDFVWAKNFGGNLAVDAYAVATDNTGNILISGYFDGTADLDPGPGTFIRTVVGYSDIYISKLDASGNLIWSKQMGGPIGEVGYAIATDNAGNVYSTGIFVGTVDFDPGTDIFNMSSPSHFDGEIFVSKLDASGNFVWAKQLGGEQAQTIALDHSGNIIIGGAGYYNWNGIALHKLSASGNVLWSKEIMASSCTSVAVDKDNNIYSTGTFFGTKDFDPGPIVFNLVGGNSDSYISKLDSSGNFVWAKRLGGNDQTWSQSITIDKYGNVYLTGYFSKTTDFDSDTSNYTLHAVGSYDVFILKLKGASPATPPGPVIRDEFRIYPNPTAGRITVKFPNDFNCSWLLVRNAIGQLMSRRYVNGAAQVDIDISGVSGVYFVEAYGAAGKKRVEKVLKLSK